MLTHEWHELEVLCQRITTLRHRYAAAQKTKNVGLLDGLKTDIERATRHRELLVQHIAAALGSVAATEITLPRGDSDTEPGDLPPEASDPARPSNQPGVTGFTEF
jgi:hypothetical protein